MLGIDLVENNRFKNKSEEFINRILSSDELKVYSSFTNEMRKLTYLASRFSAKEAIFKACKEGDKSLNYKDISVLNYANGAPYVRIEKYPDLVFEISISHTDTFSQAIVIKK